MTLFIFHTFSEEGTLGHPCGRVKDILVLQATCSRDYDITRVVIWDY